MREIKRVFFRTDSNKVISSGHVMRSLALADAVSAEGLECIFITSDGDMANEIVSRGFKQISLGSDWRNLETDFPYIEQLLKEYAPAAVVVDTYSISEEYVQRVCRYTNVGYLGSKQIVAPELFLLVNYSTNIDHAFYQNNYQNCSTRLLLGPQFAPLRYQFQGVTHKISPDVEDILIISGNSGNLDFYECLFELVGNHDLLSKLRYTIVAGRYFKQDLSKALRKMPSGTFSVVSDVQDIASLMCGADIAVSACGTTVYELGACSVSTVGYALVEEQVISAKGLENRGAILYAGKVYEDPRRCAQRIVEYLETLVLDLSLRERLSQTIHSISDGYGSRRIAQEMKRLLNGDSE